MVRPVITSYSIHYTKLYEQSAAGLLGVLFGRTLDTHQTMFAMGEAIAHLNYLEHAGRLTKEIDSAGLIRYSRLPQRSATH